jgi:hypothetical protein
MEIDNDVREEVKITLKYGLQSGLINEGLWDKLIEDKSRTVYSWSEDLKPSISSRKKENLIT